MAVEYMDFPDEISAFGSLSYHKKIDITAPSDALVSSLPYREGQRVSSAALVAKLTNPQIDLAVLRAENTLAQAESAVDLSRARLQEGRCSTEARLLAIAKAEAEIAQARREEAEGKRKLEDQESLFQAGGLSEDAMQSLRFAFETQRERIDLMNRDLAIQRIGLRDEDLANSEFFASNVEALSLEAKKQALINLSTQSLTAELRASQARSAAARTELVSAQHAAQELLVYAPASALVGARYIEEGERVRASDKLLTLIDSSSLYALVSVGEGVALRLQKGMQAQVIVDGAASEGSPATFKALVDLVSPLADSRSASFSVRLRLLEPEAALKPGMFARATITLGSPRRGLVIPRTAILEGNRAFALVGSLVSERRLSLGAEYGEYQEVLSGLEQGELIIDKSDASLQEGEHVSVE
ncbi:efflux RND transporter periplasmic adaptor subunit [Treponema sp.]